ncbi:hypothetical protein [Jeotgalibacillus aurantiacus]|uniref:hypothetical protein n=1 Tax=Jeotgalibacillus aurantiacus TaxID=2763266 RepID=UPI001D0AD220|nr:hypothetical protein [Jeotgalibacillus aurantiacus]
MKPMTIWEVTPENKDTPPIYVVTESDHMSAAIELAEASVRCEYNGIKRFAYTFTFDDKK